MGKNPAEHRPGFPEFLRLARRGNVIPVTRKIGADFETPLSAYLKLEGKGPAYLLESAEGGERWGRFSFIGSEPARVISSKGRDPLPELERLSREYRSVPVPGLPRFTGGFVGYAGYDTVRFLEPVGPKKRDVLGVPDSVWMLSDSLVIFDHLEHVMNVVCNAVIPSGSAGSLERRAQAAYHRAVQRVDRMVHRLREPLSATIASFDRVESKLARKPGATPTSAARRGWVRSNLSPAAFTRAVARAKQAISQGEAIQIVLSQRFETPFSYHPFEIYRALRSLNPSPYMFYLNLGSFALAGSSPEVLVRCEEGTVQVRPIAGTRPRGKTPAADRKIEEGLKRDPKERAEHLMLADLGRNDLGRICEYGSVKVRDLMTVERYSHVMHLVSDITGRLRTGKSAFDVFRACFPAGTVTGAPKVRAMQIINELEPDSRGPYAGAVGYIGFNGNLDTCITIRTVLVKGKKATVQAGAGIVADSVPQREYRETCNKAAGMLEAIRRAQRGPE